MSRTINFTAGLILVWLTGYLLLAGRSILIPFIIAIFIWNLLNTINNALLKTPLIGGYLPRWLSMLLALSIVVFLVMILLNIITNNVNEVILASTRYQDNLTRILNSLDAQYQTKILAGFDSFFKSLNVQNMIINIYGVFSTVMGSAVLIGLYVIFLFVEQHYFSQKLNALFPLRHNRLLVDSIIEQIVKDTQTYLGLKTLMSLVTATASWVIMKWVGLDFAEFWALLIFFLNYIPNIGAIIATAFPALLAIIQFNTWLPFMVITGGIVSVQFVIGNLVEPRFLSQSLNLSPLIILIALGIWGAIWGILGMFLAVPITVMIMIIFAHFQTTRPIAILLSQDGYIKDNLPTYVVSE